MTHLKAPLSHEIEKKYECLRKLVVHISCADRELKQIDGTGGKVSVTDLIAYQIGWGKSLIRWYESGIAGKLPVMPGDGFSTWDYAAIAKHFYQNYRYDGAELQDRAFQEVVVQIIKIVEKEFEKGQLDKVGIWDWCTLASGKEWPLSKWVRVNTCAPYKRAFQLIRKQEKNI